MHPPSLLVLKQAPLLLVLSLHLPSVALNLILIHLVDLKLHELHLAFLVLLRKLQLLLLPLDLRLILITEGRLVLLKLTLALLL